MICLRPALVLVPALLLSALLAVHGHADPGAVENALISGLTAFQVAGERLLDGDPAGALRALLQV